jgi:hypothetical protein
MKFPSFSAAAMLLGMATLLGCTPQVKVEDPAILAQRSKLVLADEPQGAMSITDARKDLEQEKEVVLIGKVGAGDSTPWEQGKTVFLISENGTVEESRDHDAPGHDAENCPFCKRRKKRSMAMVRFVDKDGQVLPFDARELLGVKENQVVVVKGLAKVNDLDVLVVTADGIHLR